MKTPGKQPQDKPEGTIDLWGIAERIARSLGQEELVDFAWLLGLLHDIGRFGNNRPLG